MNIHKNQIKSLTIDKKNNQNSFRRKHNMFSKSQTSSNILSHLFQKKYPIKPKINNNSSKSSSKGNEFFDEEINYNIDSTKNIHDSTYCSNNKKESRKDGANLFDNEEIIKKNFEQKEYWLEEKNSYIKELEKQIKKQNNIINGLLNESSSNTKNVNNHEKSAINNSLLDYNYANKKIVKKMEQKKNKNRTFIEEYTNNELSSNNTFNSYINNNSKITNNKRIYEPKDKYDSLYSKYLNLLNDFKYLNNNDKNEKSLTKLQNKYNSLLEENKNLKSKLKSKNKTIKNQQKEISELRKLYSQKQNLENKESNKEIIKELQEQCESFRKDLVLSQAMVNSLKAEIDVLKKTDTKSIINNANKGNKKKKKNNDTIDKYSFTFNNNYNQSASISPKNNLEKSMNINTNSFNGYSNKELINSLNNKNKLLTKVLQENNLLRNKLKKFDSFLPNFIDVYDTNELKEINKERFKEDLIKKYEEKFQYFSFYIKRIKIIINDIFKDIPDTLNKYLNKNNNLSEKFILSLYDLRKEYYTIKKIDEFNLDVTDDEKCIKIYKDLIKLLNNELELFINNDNNLNINTNDNVISDLTNISNNNFNASNINNYRYLEKDNKNENDINYLKNYSYNNEKKLNISDLNIGRIEEEKNDNLNLIQMENINKYINKDIIQKGNNKKITYITNYGNKNTNNKRPIINYNREYFFDYGAYSNNHLMFSKE